MALTGRAALLAALCSLVVPFTPRPGLTVLGAWLLLAVLVAVDLAHPTGVGAELTRAARDWQRRRAAELGLLLVAAWLAELADALREAAEAEGERTR
mgnify:CR=1 FL=1